MTAQEIQNWIVVANLIITAIITIILQHQSKSSARATFLDQQLFALQNLALQYPFLEDTNFTQQWDTMRKQYVSNIEFENKVKFLQYDSYTEMIFNYIYQSFVFYGSEEKLLQQVDVKNWIRHHKQCWQNPLVPHSNRDTYGNEFADLMDKWLK